MAAQTQQIRMFTNGWIDKVSASIDKEVKNLVDGVIDTLSYIGERAVTIARERGDYMNRTGNLRSSIGYVILHDGQPVRQGEPEVYGEGNQGSQVAEELLTMVRSEYPQGIVLIVCAGMNYASYVEDIYGKDVLTSARLETEQLAERMLKELLNA